MVLSLDRRILRIAQLIAWSAFRRRGIDSHRISSTLGTSRVMYTRYSFRILSNTPGSSNPLGRSSFPGRICVTWNIVSILLVGNKGSILISPGSALYCRVDDQGILLPQLGEFCCPSLASSTWLSASGHPW